jgi:predicted NAD/FAD-binding protein
MKIAVIGTGISGLAAAWLLSRRHEVVLYEQDCRPGGHTNTFVARHAGGEQAIDTGFIVYNELNYPRLSAMFRALGVASQPSDMSFAVSLAGGAYEYAGNSLYSLFAQGSNLGSAAHWRMLRDILRFNAAAKRGYRARSLPEVPIGEWLEAEGYSREFRSRYLLPMAGSIWSCSMHQVTQFPLPYFVDFYHRHCLLNLVRRPQWRMVTGGSHSYVSRLLAQFRGQLRLQARVLSLRRTEHAAYVATDAGEERYDYVVSAAHSDQALKYLADADTLERRLLGAIGYAPNEAWLHTDTSFLPRRRSVWASWNYLNEDAQRCDEIGDRAICLSYWMNLLQRIPGPSQYVVTLNPYRQPPDEKVLYHTVYDHPQYTAAAVEAQRLLPAIQNQRRTWFCGAWTAYGFHEDGLKSAIAAATALGCPPDWAGGAAGTDREAGLTPAGVPLPEAAG